MMGLEGWSGPYASEVEGAEYYYNESRNISTWESPVAEFESDLFTRYSVLYRALLPEKCAGMDQANPESLFAQQGADLLTRLQLPLELVKPSKDDEAPKTPSTSRSFHTARSACSARSLGGRHEELSTPSRGRQ